MATGLVAKRSVALPSRPFSTIPTLGEVEKRRKKLLWRAKCRGWLELDVLMGTFAEKKLPEYGDDKMDLLEEILELENPDLFKWFTGQAPVPEEIGDNPVLVDMMQFVRADRDGGIGRGREDPMAARH